MADRAKLTLPDHVMLHAMQVLSRPCLCDGGNISITVSILREVMPRVSRGDDRLGQIIVIADKFATQRPCPIGDFGGLHDRAAQVMRDWDARRLADAWDALRGQS